MTTRMQSCALAIGVVTALTTTLAAQDRSPARTQPQVEMVQTTGCVEQRPDGGWWLTRAAEAEVTRPGVFNHVQVDEVRDALAPGTNEFQLVGVADFLDADGLLATRGRTEFTTPDQANATGELRPGRTVLVKGLLIEDDDLSRINLTAVVGLSDTCGSN